VSDRRRVIDMLELIGLTAGVPAEKLSGGQSQRLSIACALIHDPDVQFLDELTAALDPQARRNLWDLLRDINRRGKTIVLTHPPPGRGRTALRPRCPGRVAGPRGHPAPRWRPSWFSSPSR